MCLFSDDELYLWVYCVEIQIIQQSEQTKIIEILKEHHIVEYFRYVDNISIVYNMGTVNIDIL